ncbi:hypothetical protein BU25DRAFT_257133 [Macroventuria anomochaeta]|uniref:Uncharacterized protein n=1 Tax=Macroventuria anomochaeta TaxID=301207 RepID=A0ACB6S7X5_9PLEO|nr:uncharacterized protein BU25DRAFT_257133 [Macroventuria anomochaeta]KAF2630381.1 hypothetical protein BU25DRAFT_257133 [Macroventuria anomochaeta]
MVAYPVGIRALFCKIYWTVLALNAGARTLMVAACFLWIGYHSEGRRLRRVYNIATMQNAYSRLQSSDAFSDMRLDQPTDWMEVHNALLETNLHSADHFQATHHLVDTPSPKDTSDTHFVKQRSMDSNSCRRVHSRDFPARSHLTLFTPCLRHASNMQPLPRLRRQRNAIANARSDGPEASPMKTNTKAMDDENSPSAMSWEATRRASRDPTGFISWQMARHGWSPKEDHTAD